MDIEKFYVDNDIRKAESLPPEAFVSKELLELELKTVFRKTWLPVPELSAAEFQEYGKNSSLLDRVTIAGSEIPFRVLDQELYLKRDWDGNGKLHCFPNSCTHAWHTLVQGWGRTRTTICPQHGRQFDGKGRFVSQPGFEGLENFPRECDNLQDLAIEQWNRFLFVNLWASIAPFTEFFGPMAESVAGLSLETFPRAHPVRYPHVATELYRAEGNWKLHVMNYMDTFHLPFIHRAPGGLADGLEMASYTTELHDNSALQWAYARNPEHGFDPEIIPKRFYSAAGRRVFALWWYIAPNMFFNFYPWGLSLSILWPDLKNPEQTTFVTYQYIMNEANYMRRDEIWKGKRVNAEDFDAMAKVARGARSLWAPRGRFAPEKEKGPHWFHRWAHDAVFS